MNEGPRNQEATRYFEQISALLRTVALTTEDGTVLSLDIGTARVVQQLAELPGSSSRVMLIGNGGSASIAEHMHLDLCNRARLAALVFNDPAILTAVSNDHGYETYFSRMVELWARPGDILIAISSSGQSENILRAVREAQARNCRVISLSGFRADNPLRGSGEYNYYVASENYGHVEVVHHALGHYLTDRVTEAALEAKQSR